MGICWQCDRHQPDWIRDWLSFAAAYPPAAIWNAEKKSSLWNLAGHFDTSQLLNNHALIKRKSTLMQGDEWSWITLQDTDWSSILSWRRKELKEVLVETQEYKEVLFRLDYLLATKGKLGLLTGSAGGKTTPLNQGLLGLGLNTSLYKWGTFRSFHPDCKSIFTGILPLNLAPSLHSWKPITKIIRVKSTVSYLRNDSACHHHRWSELYWKHKCSMTKCCSTLKWIQKDRAVIICCFFSRSALAQQHPAEHPEPFRQRELSWIIIWKAWQSRRNILCYCKTRMVRMHTNGIQKRKCFSKRSSMQRMGLHVWSTSCVMQVCWLKQLKFKYHPSADAVVRSNQWLRARITFRNHHVKMIPPWFYYKTVCRNRPKLCSWYRCCRAL